jgi:glutathione S-transferase
MSANKLQDDIPEWKVLYHAPGQFKGRGECLRLMLEDAGVPYKNSAEHLYGPNGLMDGFRGHNDEAMQNTTGSATFPLLFPPAIWHHPKDSGNVAPIMINQTAACMIYIGDMLGYAPSSPVERARANAVTLNAMDYIAEGRASFHPVKNSMSYKDQKEEGDKASQEFVKTRMKTYLYHFRNVVVTSGVTAPVAGGKSITYADFALFHALDATVAQFNTEFYGYAWDSFDGKELKEFYQWMKQRPNLQDYFQSDRCARTCDLILGRLWLFLYSCNDDVIL